MIKGFVIGFVLAVIILTRRFYFYFVRGMAPAATADPPMPFEKAGIPAIEWRAVPVDSNL
jgi:hypothetical protein